MCDRILLSLCVVKTRGVFAERGHSLECKIRNVLEFGSRGGSMRGVVVNRIKKNRDNETKRSSTLQSEYNDYSTTHRDYCGTQGHRDTGTIEG